MYIKEEEWERNKDDIFDGEDYFGEDNKLIWVNIPAFDKSHLLKSEILLNYFESLERSYKRPQYVATTRFRDFSPIQEKFSITPEYKTALASYSRTVKKMAGNGLIRKDYCQSIFNPYRSLREVSFNMSMSAQGKKERVKVPESKNVEGIALLGKGTEIAKEFLKC
jgi:hypothetical protein